MTDDMSLGRRSDRDTVHLGPALRLAAMLDRADLATRLAEPRATLPPCWHWLYHLPLTVQAALGPDGHERVGGFIPDVQLPRRMWAGSRLRFVAPVPMGSILERTSSVTRVSPKQGRSGPLTLVTVRHTIRADGTPAIEDEHDIVYRAAATPGDRSRRAPDLSEAPGQVQFGRRVTPDPTLLFRYSALTFNTHRIHYDRDYATRVDGYPGLVVHAPLQATLLLDLLDREFPDARLSTFSFRALAPVFDTTAMHLAGARDGSTVRLWTSAENGEVALVAIAEVD